MSIVEVLCLRGARLEQVAGTRPLCPKASGLWDKRSILGSIGNSYSAAYSLAGLNSLVTRTEFIIIKSTK